MTLVQDIVLDLIKYFVEILTIICILVAASEQQGGRGQHTSDDDRRIYTQQFIGMAMKTNYDKIAKAPFDKWGLIFFFWLKYDIL